MSLKRNRGDKHDYFETRHSSSYCNRTLIKLETPMKAVGYKVPGPIAENASLVDIDLPRPVAAGHDILVEVMAVSVNPVDYKVRGSSPPADGDWKVLGWDAAGIVREVGSDVTQFKAGDEVYYAGSITRSGTNAQFHLVDARIVGKKPTSLDWGSSQKTENKAR